MKNSLKIVFLSLFVLAISEAKAAKPGDGGGNNNDSTSGLKSNIVIFKMMTTPSSSPATNNGSLKKAGKVARTSNSHSSTKSAAPVSGNEG